jgi:hypothetical protein
MNYKKNMSRSLLFLFFSLIIFVGVTIAQETTITGVIVNLEKVKIFIEKESYIQLIALPPYNKLERSVFFRNDGVLLYFYNSELPKIDIPSNNTFSFKVKDLKPGKYAIAIQKISIPLPYNSQCVAQIFHKDEECESLAIIEITQESGNQITINIGNVFVPVK